MSTSDVVAQLLESIGMSPKHTLPEDVVRLQIHGNKVVDSHLLPGIQADVEEQADGVSVQIRVKRGVTITKPVHLCFGLLPEKGLQQIEMDLHVEEDSDASVLAHCTFPNAVDVQHKMNARIHIGSGAKYSYLERHVHGGHGGVLVVPKAVITLEEGARFKTEFELIRGRAGTVSFDYLAVCKAKSVLEMVARISGRSDDSIEIRESARLEGDHARAILKTSIAVKDSARAQVYNAISAHGAYSRGHVDCKEIVQGKAVASATPLVEVKNPTAHVTHEAAIGSVDSKQLETLMSRGLTEDEAVELIVQGLLS